MALRSTKLSTIMNRMGRYQALQQNANPTNQVRDIDEAIRRLRRLLPLIWNLQKSSLRVFDEVDTYPVASDHDELAYLDTSKNVLYPARARFRYTSLVQFFEDASNRNTIAEVWSGGQRTLGVKYKNISNGSTGLNNAETLIDWTASGVASSPALDQVFFKEGNAAIRFGVTGNGTASMKNILTTNVTDADYKKKYQFKWIYLDVVPTSISLRLNVDAGNYLQTTGITTQFDGTPLVADQWNLVAQDLNTAVLTGTVGASPIFTYEEFDLVGASAGTFYVDASYLRAWELMDYWYYSIFSIIASGGTAATKEYFMDEAAGTYVPDDSLLGDSEWSDLIQTGAEIRQCVDIKDKDFLADAKERFAEAFDAFTQKYPSMDPVTIQDRWNFVEDFLTPAGDSEI